MSTQIPNFKNLSWNRPGFSFKEPPVVQILPIIFGLLFGLALIWSWIGEIELTVTAKGVVRSAKPVGKVRNSLAGILSDIKYQKGDRVDSGQVLFSIDTTKLETNIHGLANKERKRIDELGEIDDLRNSIENDKEPLKKGGRHENRYIVYKLRRDQLQLALEQAERKYRSKTIMRDAVSAKKLKDLEAEYKESQIVLKKHKYDFLAELDRIEMEIEEQMMEIRDEIRLLETKVQKGSVQAPIEGRIQQLVSIQPGEYIPAEMEVLRIIPEESRYNLEIHVPSEKMGNITEGQKIRYSFPALSRQKHGQFSGKIETISKDIFEDNHGNLFYKVDCKGLEGGDIDVKRIRPGMVARVNIVTGKQRILLYLLDRLDFFH